MDPWLTSGIVSVVTAQAAAVVYLFKENRRLVRASAKKIGALRKAEAKCQLALAGLRSDYNSLAAMIEQMRWSGPNTIDAVVVANMTTGQIVEWNPSATLLFHWTEREMLGKPVTKIMPERYKEAHRAAIDRLRQTEEAPKRGPLFGHALTKDGYEIPVSITLSGWRDGSTAMVAAHISRRLEPPDATGAAN